MQPFATDRDAARAGSRITVRDRAQSAGAAIAAHYRTAILTGLLPTGARLPPERDIAGEFAANRKTVREALAQLVAERLLERRRGSGSYVIWRSPTPQAAREDPAPAVSPQDVIEARLVIEPGLCALVAARATEDDFARMRAALHAMEAAVDHVAYKVAGYEFYLAVVRATRNPLLTACYEMLVSARAKAGWGTLLSLNARAEQRRAQTAANWAIYQALRNRHAAAARALIEAHLAEMVHHLTEAA